MNSSSGSKRLPLHEWLVVLLLAAGMLLITFITHFSTPSSHPLGGFSSIEVTIEGAVEYPQTFCVPRGTTLSEIIDQAHLLPNADIESLRLHKVVRDGEIIEIPEINMITIFVEGAVISPGPLKVRQGTKVCDLTPLLEPLPEADISCLKRKRKLKEGEKVTIPSKSQPLKIAKKKGKKTPTT